MGMNTRQLELMERIKEKKALPLEALAKEVAYSVSTIRRDVMLLEEVGLVKLEKGMVKLVVSTAREKHYKLRSLEHTHGKGAIAKLCQDFLADGMSIFMDSSSTVLQVCKVVAQYKDITVITNGVEIAYELMQYPNVEVFIAGGYIKPHTSSIIGEPAIHYLEQFNFDLAFLSCAGIDDKRIYEASLQQTYVKRGVMARTKVNVLLCDSSKTYKSYKYTLGTLQEIDYLLMDEVPPKAIVEVAEKMDCEVVVSDVVKA